MGIDTHDEWFERTRNRDAVKWLNLAQRSRFGGMVAAQDFPDLNYLSSRNIS
jgi:hypothetical protein